MRAPRDVLPTVSPSPRVFLLRTSVLRRLCGSLCDAVAGTEGSGAMLRDLNRANLFIGPLGTDGRWYRYHQLFAEALRLELEVTEPNLVWELHIRAATWFERDGDLEPATEHAIAARAAGLSARLILRQLQPLVAAGTWPRSNAGSRSCHGRRRSKTRNWRPRARGTCSRRPGFARVRGEPAPVVLRGRQCGKDAFLMGRSRRVTRGGR
jgi:hypothetical protein